MTINNNEELKNTEETPNTFGRLTYIKPTGDEEAHRLGLIPAGITLPPGVKLYVLHAVDGSVLGYTDAYESAWGAAVQNELTPVSVH
ncbi:MAG: DUF1150 family protein [Alphaproteobacteria bacterium]|nr:DUF1150 family protein [Alphaproteobacteria bacterium]MBL6939658.1 DUF1150 family protein [Alphaproteobacteria bacterium]MBL7097020.1 DUF1150 family protein [Alphaproteobacteria bacterium]